MAAAERELWDELHHLHLSLAPASAVSGVANKMTLHQVNSTYESEINTRISKLQDISLQNLCDESLSEGLRMLIFHSHRRLLSLLQQESDMLRLEHAQARAIGEDRAFIALGRW